MTRKYRILFFFLFAIAAALFAILFPYTVTSAVMSPSGAVAIAERDLINLSTILMLIIVIPVLMLTFFVCLRYRADHKGSKYDPYWDYNLWAESLWWGFPFVIVVSLSIVAWQSSFALDPFKQLDKDKPPLNIQVVALQWKWLFIYPEQQIATINTLHIPEKTPIHFEITADAPMNSFWIPALAGQIYAMPGMKTQLNLIADKQGSFRGSSANLSGEGFAGMTFETVATSQEAFDGWIQSAKQSEKSLTQETYSELVKPTAYHPEEVYVLKDGTLFEQIIMKFMTPPKTLKTIETKE